MICMLILYAVYEDLKTGVQTHHNADRHDHLQVRGFVVGLAAANLGKQVRAAPAEQRNHGKPEPHMFCILSSIFNLNLQIDQSGFDHLLQAHQDAELGMHPRQAALEIDGIRRADRTVGGKFDGRTLHKRAGAMMTWLS